jgi:hypothetical protein
VGPFVWEEIHQPKQVPAKYFVWPLYLLDCWLPFLNRKVGLVQWYGKRHQSPFPRIQSIHSNADEIARPGFGAGGDFGPQEVGDDRRVEDLGCTGIGTTVRNRREVEERVYRGPRSWIQ